MDDENDASASPDPLTAQAAIAILGVRRSEEAVDLNSRGGLMESKPNELSSAAALMGAKGGRAGKGKAKIRKTSFDSLSGSMAGAVGGAAGTGTAKRRNIDYAAIGRKGAQARRENLVAVEPKT